MSEFQGRTAIVTGGSRGIGRAIAKELASRGAGVAFSYTKNRELADELVKEIESTGGRAIAFQGDVADGKSAEEMVRQVR